MMARRGRAILPASLAFALRELRGARRGFGIFLACLALGVAAIAGIGSFARALSDGLDREGRVILGGDAAFTLVQREANRREMGFFTLRGEVSRVATLRAMARAPSGDAALVELKAVDGAYPLVGQLDVEPELSARALFAPLSSGLPGAVADAVLMGRLDLKIGDELKVGDATFQIRAQLVSEPDKLSGGIGLGPRLLISSDALAQTGLIQPGSLVRWSYRLRLNDPSAANLEKVMDDAHDRLADGGFEMRTRLGATPQLERNVDRISQFLTLVALTALLVGGVGEANAVTSHLSAKRETIATLKAMGATRGQIFSAYGLEMGLIAALGIAMGLAVGAAIPFLADAVLSQLIPFPLAPRIEFGALGLAALYGVLVAGLFTLWPLAGAQETRVALLFRDVTGQSVRPGRRYLLLLGLLLALLCAVALASAVDVRAAAVFLAAAAGVFALLRLVGLAIMALARRLPRPHGVVPRLALANIHRPGAITPTVVLSLGLGLSLLVAVALIDRSLTGELSASMEGDAPSFFFVDVPGAEQEAFAAFLKQKAPEAELRSAPMLRGRITELNGIPVENVRPSTDAAWVLQSDRGITASDTVPEGSRVVEGTWWGPGEQRPLVSFDAKLAAGLGLKVGETLTVNVLGRPITATIANLRDVKWEKLGINFVMVFSPGAFAGAPFTVLSTLTFPQGASTEREVALLNQVAAAYPQVTAVRVKETLEEARRMLDNLSLGIRAASLLTLLTSMLVLAGALAAGHQHRVYDAVILKTLGATRSRLLAAYGLEYAAVGLLTAAVAVLAGTLAALGVVWWVMDLEFVFSAWVAVGAVAGTLLLTVGLGLLGTWRALGEAPARVLRHL